MIYVSMYIEVQSFLNATEEQTLPERPPNVYVGCCMRELCDFG